MIEVYEAWTREELWTLLKLSVADGHQLRRKLRQFKSDASRSQDIVGSEQVSDRRTATEVSDGVVVRPICSTCKLRGYEQCTLPRPDGHHRCVDYQSDPAAF